MEQEKKKRKPKNKFRLKILSKYGFSDTVVFQMITYALHVNYCITVYATVYCNSMFFEFSFYVQFEAKFMLTCRLRGTGAEHNNNSLLFQKIVNRK